MKRVANFPIYEWMSVLLGGGQTASGIYRNEGCDVLHLFWNQANNSNDEFSQGFSRYPNVRRSLSYVVKWLLQWPATEERFAEDKLDDRPCAQIYDQNTIWDLKTTQLVVQLPCQSRKALKIIFCRKYFLFNPTTHMSQWFVSFLCLCNLTICFVFYWTISIFGLRIGENVYHNLHWGCPKRFLDKHFNFIPF